MAKLFAAAGVVTITSFICPRNELRTLAREIVGKADFFEVYVECSFETCEQRDVKGLYAKAKAGQVQNFTGRDSSFEAPEPRDAADLILNTDNQAEGESLEQLYQAVRLRVAARNNMSEQKGYQLTSSNWRRNRSSSCGRSPRNSASRHCCFPVAKTPL